MNLFLPPLRPPGAVDERHFITLCIRCGQCLEVCPHDSLKLAGGFGAARFTPYVAPEEAPCLLCMKCPPVCPTGALDPECVQTENANMGKAYILADACHNFTKGPMCWTCYDRCPLRGKAIVLSGGITPAITDDCVGCGVCAHVCPKDAVVIVPKSSDYAPASAAPGAPKA